jgi:hypothetical protein
VLASRERLEGECDVELIGFGDDHRFEARVGQHPREVVVDDPRLVHRGHAFGQVWRRVADGVQVRIARLSDRIEMRGLGDRPAAKQANAQAALVFVHGSVCSFKCAAGLLLRVRAPKDSD